MCIFNLHALNDLGSLTLQVVQQVSGNGLQLVSQESLNYRKH